MRDIKQVLLWLTWYDYRIHRGVAQVAGEAGWHLICPKDASDARRLGENWRGHGCIALTDEKDTLEYFISQNIPLVSLGLQTHRLGIPRVVVDNEQIGRLAAEHFHEHGYKEIFAISPRGISMFRERLDAVMRATAAQGGVVHVLDGHPNPSVSLYTQLHQVALNRGNRLEELSIAIFAYEDYHAAEVISMCLEHGLHVPNNVAVLGVDNDDLINNGLAVKLSSIDSDQEGLGRAGALLLRQMLDRPDEAPPTQIIRHPPIGIIARQSTDVFAVNSPLVAKALHWIHTHVREGIQASDVARAMSVSQQGLQKAFARHRVRTPGQEIRRQRLEAVVHALTFTRAKLAEIADSCGYGTVDNLINCFRAVHEITPGQFRKRIDALRLRSAPRGY